VNAPPLGTPLRIMLVSDQYPPMVGGVPTVVSQLAAGLAARGHDVAVLAPSHGWRGGTGSAGGARVSYTGSAPWPLYPGLRIAAARPATVRRQVAAFGPDVVHAHSPLTLGRAAVAAARQLAVPAVYTNHYLPANVLPAMQRRPAAFDRAFYSYVVGFGNRCTLVTAPTVTALGLLDAHGLTVPGRVISNGIDTASFRPGPADAVLRDRYGLAGDEPVILSLGRLSPEKRADVLIDAVARLTVPARLVLAGTGPDAGRLAARARKLGVASQVLFPGFIPDADLAGLYRLGHVFATASEAELQGITTMHALASGLPVVAARAGALSELVTHGTSGYLFVPGQASHAAKYLSTLLADRPLRERIAAAARPPIIAHDLRHCLADWEQTYAVLSNRGGWHLPSPEGRGIPATTR
jgi:1,2-diacylglycerol 3-alpha-glucosyltransferase